MAAVVGQRHSALSLFLLFFLVAGGLPSLRLRGDARELAEELTNEGAGEGLQLLLLDLVIVVGVDRPEHRIDVLVGDGDANVVRVEEVGEELAELTPVQVRIVVAVVRLEVLGDLRVELGAILVESLDLVEGRLEFALAKVRRVDHFFLMN